MLHKRLTLISTFCFHIPYKQLLSKHNLYCCGHNLLQVLLLQKGQLVRFKSVKSDTSVSISLYAFTKCVNSLWLTYL